MTEAALAKKLGIKAGHRVLFFNTPAGYVESFAPLPDGVEVAEKPGGEFDVVHLFVRDTAEIDRLALAAIAATKPDGVLWISYPKRSSKVPTDVTRDVGWDAVTGAGWAGVAQVSVDETWSALRFKPEATVRRAGRRDAVAVG